jgi:hypothetical protein
MSCLQPSRIRLHSRPWLSHPTPLEALAFPAVDRNHSTRGNPIPRFVRPKVQYKMPSYSGPHIPHHPPHSKLKMGLLFPHDERVFVPTTASSSARSLAVLIHEFQHHIVVQNNLR